MVVWGVERYKRREDTKGLSKKAEPFLEKREEGGSKGARGWYRTSIGEKIKKGMKGFIEKKSRRRRRFTSVVGIYLPSGASASEGLEEGVVVRAVDSFGVFGRRPVLEVLSGGGRGFLLG
jgi:hypothetical protein